MNYEIITDSASNLTPELVHKYGLIMLPIEYMQNDIAYDGYRDTNDVTWLKSFYASLRNKESVLTSCLNASTLNEKFIPLLESGKDILYICFSSGLSKTYSIAKEVIEELKIKFPERKIYLVDSVSASFGQGLLVDYAARQRNEGKTIDEVYEWQENNKLNLCHWFTVDDLFFLKRGGRISAATAIAGTVLGIKPVMHVDNEGRLVNVSKARGRRQSLIELVNRMCETAIKPKDQRIFISHGDSPQDAEFVADLVREKLKVTDITITYINPTIGAHSGPGTVALFFYGTER